MTEEELDEILRDFMCNESEYLSVSERMKERIKKEIFDKIEAEQET